MKKINLEKRTETLAIELGAFANCGNLDTVKVETSSLNFQLNEEEARGYISKFDD